MQIFFRENYNDIKKLLRSGAEHHALWANKRTRDRECKVDCNTRRANFFFF